MSTLEPSDVVEFVSVEEDEEFLTFLESGTSGLLVVPEAHGESGSMLLTADTGDFVKWIQLQEPALEVTVGESQGRLVRRSSNYWLPLVFLATDVSLPIYLNLVSNYLYDKMKGALRDEKARVHLSAMYKDSSDGVVKKLTFEGDTDTLHEVLQNLGDGSFFSD